MPAYDATLFDPPAPFAYITLHDPISGVTWIDAPMLLDTSADVTLIPQEVINKLGITALPDRQYELSGFDGQTNYSGVVRLELVFCRRTFRGQFLLTEQSWGILGRNVLNSVALTFNGPQLSWNELNK